VLDTDGTVNAGTHGNTSNKSTIPSQTPHTHEMFVHSQARMERDGSDFIKQFPSALKPMAALGPTRNIDSSVTVRHARTRLNRQKTRRRHELHERLQERLLLKAIPAFALSHFVSGCVLEATVENPARADLEFESLFFSVCEWTGNSWLYRPCHLHRRTMWIASPCLPLSSEGNFIVKR